MKLIIHLGEKIMIKIVIAAFLILGFVSAAVASARWKEKDKDE